MYAQLGTIEFKDLKGFITFGKKGSATYALHQLLNGKPRLQNTGNDLDEISISIRLHYSFCDPEKELLAFNEYRVNGEVLTLQYGNGIIVGRYVLVTIEESVEDANSEGTILSYLVNFNLKEYVFNDRLQKQQSENRSKARAVGNIKPVSAIRTNVPPCSNIISSLVSQIQNIAAYINLLIIERGGIGLTDNRHKVLVGLRMVKDAGTDLMARTEDPESCAYQKTDLESICKELQDAVNSFITIVESNIIYQAPLQNRTFQATVKKLKAVTIIFVTNTITGK